MDDVEWSRADALGMQIVELSQEVHGLIDESNMAARLEFDATVQLCRNLHADMMKVLDEVRHLRAGLMFAPTGVTASGAAGYLAGRALRSLLVPRKETCRE